MNVSEVHRKDLLYTTVYLVLYIWHARSTAVV